MHHQPSIIPAEKADRPLPKQDVTGSTMYVEITVNDAKGRPSTRYVPVAELAQPLR